MSDAPIAVLLIVTILGNAMAAALSAGEAAVLRASRTAVADAVARHPQRRSRIEAIMADPQRTASAAALVRVISETIAAVCLTIAVSGLVSSWWLVLVIAGLASVLFALVLVRLSPRTVGRNRPGRTLGWASGILRVALTIAKAAPWAVATRPGIREGGPGGELVEMVDRAEESGAIEELERDMLRSVVELSNTMTREVMVPRTDMIVINAEETLPRAQRLFLRSGYSRIPVIGDSTDDLLGVLYFKDVVRVLDEGSSRSGSSAHERQVKEVMRSPMFVPESKPVDALLREFQASSSSHVALVVDEYGGIAGLVTVEDTVEEIVGELVDEHDTAAPEVEDLGEGRFRVPARCPVSELGELFDIELDDDDVDTVGGLLAKALGRVPLPGSQADVSGIHLQAERSEGRRKRLSTVIASLTAVQARPDQSPLPDHETTGDRHE